MEIPVSQLVKVLSILLIIPLGYFLKRYKIVDQKHSPLLRGLFIKVTLPATIFLAFASIQLKDEYVYLPLIGLAVVVCFAVISLFIANALKLRKPLRSVFLIIMPTLAPATVAYPFFMELFGEQGLVTISLINVGNILFLFSIDRFMVSKIAHHKASFGTYVSHFFHAPVIWATIGGLLASYYHFHSQFMHDFFQVLSNATVFIIMILLGISFEWHPDRFKQSMPIILTKTGLGLLLGFGFATLFGFTGLERLSLIIFAFVPASTITYIFVSEEKQHSIAHFEVELLAFALPLGAVLVGVLMTFQDIVHTDTIAYIGAGLLALGLYTLKQYGSK